MNLILGIIIGMAVGSLNFYLWAKQAGLFLKNKKLYLIFLGPLIRYFFLGLVLYFSIKQSQLLFAGVTIGFFLTQLIFFGLRLKNTNYHRLKTE